MSEERSATASCCWAACAIFSARFRHIITCSPSCTCTVVPYQLCRHHVQITWYLKGLIQCTLPLFVQSTKMRGAYGWLQWTGSAAILFIVSQGRCSVLCLCTRACFVALSIGGMVRVLFVYSILQGITDRSDRFGW